MPVNGLSVPVRRQQVDAVADAHAELLRQILAKHDAVVVFIVARPEIGQLPRHDRLLDFGHGALELGVDAFEVDEGIGARGRRHGATQKGGRDADDVRNLAQRLDLGAVVLDAGGLEDVRMRRRAEDAIAQLALQPGHHRHRDDQGKDADGHAQRRHDGNDGDERLPPSAEQVAQGDLKFERHTGSDPFTFCVVLDRSHSKRRGLTRHFDRIRGNRMTSRIDLLSVRSITSRSTPTPSPAVGGSPYSSART